jgi:hypothetical protein
VRGVKALATAARWWLVTPRHAAAGRRLRMRESSDDERPPCARLRDLAAAGASDSFAPRPCATKAAARPNVLSAKRAKKKRAEARLFQLDDPSAARIALGRPDIVLSAADTTLDLACILLEIAFELLRTVTRQLAGHFLDRTLHFVAHAISALVVHGVFSLLLPQECDHDIVSKAPLVTGDRMARYPRKQGD